MIGMNTPNEAQLRLLRDAMEILVGVLGNVVSQIGEKRR